jgi:hypothetical protein
VDGASDELFAGAALAEDEHVGSGAGDALDEVEDVVHLLAAAEDSLVAVARVERLAQLAVLLHERAAFERLVDDDLDLVELEGLGEIVVGADLHRFDGGVGRGVGGHHDDGRVGVQLDRAFEHDHAVGAGHSKVGDDEVVLFFDEPLHAGRAVGGGVDGVAFFEEEDLEQLSHAQFVVDHEDTAHDWASETASVPGRGAMGNSTVKVLPAPTVLVTLMRPPCSSTMRSTCARPRPVPCSLVE